MMGCGKSEIGRRLAEKTGRGFADIDEMIEDMTKVPISKFFQYEGEAAFRRLESAMLKEVAQRNDGLIVACGGGIVLDAENVRVMRETGAVVYIYRPIEAITRGMAVPDVQARPMLQGDIQKLKKIFEEREAIYEQSCTHKVINDGSIVEVVDKLAALLYLGNSAGTGGLSGP